MIQIILIGLLSTAAGAVPKNSVAEAYEKTANLNDASFVTEIVFNEGSSELSADGKSQLRDILSAAQKRGQIEQVKVLSWADREYPSKGRLGKDATKLADDRSQEIEGFIVDNVRKVDVDDHNMAEHPAELSKILRTKDVRVKRSLEQAGLSVPAKSGMPAKAGRSLVMVIVK
jgi:hypothetical protein